jgi:hypothetical protein
MKLVVISWALVIAGCASSAVDNRESISDDRLRVRQALGAEISLRGDRHKLDNLRKDEPEDKKAANDELAFFLTETQDSKQEPSAIRSRFQNLVQKKRSRFNSIVDRLHKDYEVDETKRKDDFNDAQTDRRKEAKQKKLAPDKSRELFSQLERDRADFYAAERDRRKDFEDEIHNQTKDFNDYMKERTDEFNEQMRLYTKQFEEAKKAKKKALTPNSVPAGE